MIEVYAVNVRKMQEITDSEIIRISNERLKRIERLFFEDDKKSCFIAEQIIHFYMKNVKKNAKYSISIDNNGKPKLLNVSDLHFNISHSGDWVFCAFSKSEIGIDLEKIQVAKMNIAKKYYNKSEYKKMMCTDNTTERNELFYLLWTLKESYLKNIGMGIRALSPRMRFDVDKKIRGYIDYESIEKNFVSQKFDDNYYLSICYDINEEFMKNQYVHILDFEQLFM